MLIKVRHNVEVAHRLYETQGKCENIHGHSVWVTLSLEGHRGDNGIATYAYTDPDDFITYDKELEFGAIKKQFRGYLDETYDHRLLLNAADPFAGPIFQMQQAQATAWEVQGADTQEIPSYYEVRASEQTFLPGLQSTDGDPTTENIAKWIHDWALVEAKLPVSHVEVWETSVNCAVYP
jgi:6-pyruvoyl-tetrahydropterin synthase